MGNKRVELVASARHDTWRQVLAPLTRSAYRRWVLELIAQHRRRAGRDRRGALVSAAEISLAWLIARKPVTSVIVGAARRPRSRTTSPRRL
jgi:aryl-alcohol dehydrogenase-like predicted oxidoreductase